MGSLEKTVKVATCFNRLSAQLLSSLPWVTPPPRSGKASPSSSSSPTPPTTWQSSEELPSNRLSLPELSRDLAVSVMTATRLTAEKRTEKADLTMGTQATPHQPPTLHQPPPPPHHHLHQPLRPMLRLQQLLQFISPPPWCTDQPLWPTNQLPWSTSQLPSQLWLT